MTRTQRIVALGGGGFSMEPQNLALDRWFLSLVDAERPKVCFMPTASGDATGYIDKFHSAFARLPCEPSVLSLFRRDVDDLRAFLLSRDVIYVGGGNTANMFAIWRWRSSPSSPLTVKIGRRMSRGFGSDAATTPTRDREALRCRARWVLRERVRPSDVPRIRQPR